MASFWSIVRLLAIAVVFVVIGAALEKYRVLPARGFDHLADYVTFVVRSHQQGAKEFLAKQYSLDTQEIPLDRRIDSALLPLEIHGVRLSNSFEVPKNAGGIVGIGNTIIIVDRLGNFFAVERSGSVRKLAFPHLPNNLEAYVAANGRIDNDDFRVYSLVFLKATGELAVSHETYDIENKGTRMGISLIGIDPATLNARGNWRSIFKADIESGFPTTTGGGRLAADGDGNVYVTVGSYQINGTDVAQSDTSLFGKIIKLDVSTGKTTVISKGHRNPQGIVITGTGNIWSAEHGPYGGDELNRIVAGANYGWPRVTLGTEYGRYTWEAGGTVGRHDGYEPPVFAWVPSPAVSNLIEVKGFDARWNGDLLVSSLKAQTLYRLRFDKGTVLYSEPIWIGQRIRDMAELADGTIALWTDDTEVLFINVDKERLAANRRWPMIVGDTVVATCMFCHHFGPTSPTDPAPSLSNLFDRKIASDNYRYSPALRAKEGKWTEETLKQFLADPDRFASGTSMPSRGLTPLQIDEVIATLEHLDEASQESRSRQ